MIKMAAAAAAPASAVSDNNSAGLRERQSAVFSSGI